MADKKKFLEALRKTKAGKKIEGSLKGSAKKTLSKLPPITLKALGLAGLISGKIPLRYEKKLDKNTRLMLEGNPKKKSFGIFYKKSF
tara:strand:+ start:101 stop:361 length:261 start_codon:yes stop_codon:yes gene_type:complete